MEEFDTWSDFYSRIEKVAQVIAPTLLNPLISQEELKQLVIEATDQETYDWLFSIPITETIEKQFKNKTYQHELAYNFIKDNCVLLDLKHVGSVHCISTNLFAEICSELKQNNSIKICAPVETSSLIFSNQLDKFIINNTNNELNKQEIEICVKPGLFIPWKKTINNLTQKIEISLSENNICIFAVEETCYIKMCFKV
jgi:hypothetical protein